MDEAIKAGRNTDQVWRDIERTIEQRRKLVGTEAKRLSDMGQVIVAERAMVMVYALIEIVTSQLMVYRDKKKRVDNRLLSNISNEIRGLSNINRSE